MKPEPKSPKKASRKTVPASKPAPTPVTKRKVKPVKAGKKLPLAKATAPKPRKVSKPRTPARAKPPVQPPTTAARKRVAAVPPLLLEGDAPSVPLGGPSGPGVRYALGPTPPGSHLGTSGVPGELPESYGTGRLFLTARDPHWIYAAWDLTAAQLRDYNALSADRHLIVRVYEDSASGTPLSQTHVHPESRSWFIHVGRGGTKYVAELGYRDRGGAWKRISVSTATVTPSDRLSAEEAAQFVTLPADVKLEEVVAAVRELIPEHLPLIEAVEQLRAEGNTSLPRISVATPPEEMDWTPAQAASLARLVTMDALRRVWIGSLEITELIRRQLHEETSSIAAELAGRGAPSSGELAKGISSPHGIAGKGRGFWFNVNAELVIYGATEPDARLTVGGRAVSLRSDGSFSFRFALPDGEYGLDLAATSGDGVETRRADLAFGRTTRYQGEVGEHPQDPSFNPPAPENAA
jgi:hypothetical protein